MADHLTARQAAQQLGVTRATLYAYTSRGLLRSERHPGDPRQRQYHRDDVQRLKARAEARRDPAKAAQHGLHWGSPVLESGITLIHDGRVYYRGRDVMALATSATVESVAALLWQTPEHDKGLPFTEHPALSKARLSALRRWEPDIARRMQAALPLAAAADLGAYDLRPHAVRQTGVRIVRLLFAVVTGATDVAPLHRSLQSAWAPRQRAAADVIRAALILCADHELNVSAFAARCAASAGASPYDVVSAALATLQGYKHGGAGERVLSLAAETGTPRSARAAVGKLLRGGERVPGFGHPLYRDGDPRARMLIELGERSGNGRGWRPFRNLRKAGEELLGEHPNLDFGLAAVTRAYRLPAQAPLVLFALGRTIGWIAHAMEEYATGQLIRPRARYTGILPDAINAVP